MRILTRASEKVLNDLVALADGRYDLVKDVLEELSPRKPTLSEVVDAVLARRDESVEQTAEPVG